jgi:hypothetical protein
MIRVQWKNLNTNATGHAKWLENSRRAALNATVDEQNRKYPKTEHWIESSPDQLSAERSAVNQTGHQK